MIKPFCLETRNKNHSKNTKMALNEAKEGAHGHGPLFQAQLELWHHTFIFVKPMSLKCAIELGIPNAIHRCGGSASVPDLLAALSLPPAKLHHLRSLMRLLATSGLFAAHGGGDEAVYALTPASRLLTDGSHSNLSPFVRLVLDPVHVVPFLDMASWFKAEGEGVPATFFERTHGHTIWERTERDAVHNALVNCGADADSRFVMNAAVMNCNDVFRGIKASLVDVGGGHGAAAAVIAAAFPHVKCSVLDLPQVIAQAPVGGAVEFIAGNMFDHIPPADVVLLKWVLHDWHHDDCVKILRRCKEAIPPREAGGKVIIMEMVLQSGGQDTISEEIQPLLDIFLMHIGGGQREEHEWSSMFKEAGFSDYKITPFTVMRSIIEVFP